MRVAARLSECGAAFLQLLIIAYFIICPQFVQNLLLSALTLPQLGQVTVFSPSEAGEVITAAVMVGSGNWLCVSVCPLTSVLAAGGA